MSNLYSCAIIFQDYQNKVHLAPGYVEADSESEACEVAMERLLKQYPLSEDFYNHNVKVAEIPKKDIVAFVGRWARLMIPSDQQEES